MKASAIHQEQLEKMKARPGFSVALDQSGGSTPGVLNAWSKRKRDARAGPSDADAHHHQPELQRRAYSLVEGLSAQQSNAVFDAQLDHSIQSIYEASNT